MRIFDLATDFGTFRARDNFFAFAFKVVLYMIPAVLLGYSTDEIVSTLKDRSVLGDTPFSYVLLQTLIILSTLYLFILLSPTFTSEFQRSLAGGYFIVLYFGLQRNYITMLRDVMKSFLG